MTSRKVTIIVTDRSDRKDLVEHESHDPGTDVEYDVEFEEDDDLESRREVTAEPLPEE